MSNPRPVIHVSTAHRQREGGGFIVRRPFPSRDLDFANPFLMLDEMGPVDYAPGEAIGAPDHPHRGFETVTYVIAGEMEHEDSAGHKGKLASGDVQWMTAGRGVIHSEMPSAKMREQGGRMHGFQLWVNLPAKMKMTAPRYQEIPAASIPIAKSPDGRAEVRVVAGTALGVSAVIETHTPIIYQDWTLSEGARVEQPVGSDHMAYVYVFEGKARVADRTIEAGQLAVLGEGDSVQLGADEHARFLLLAGVPIDEPVVSYGPFVMNTRDEIMQAIRDYQSGRFGEIARH